MKTRGLDGEMYEIDAVAVALATVEHIPYSTALQRVETRVSKQQIKDLFALHGNEPDIIDDQLDRLLG